MTKLLPCPFCGHPEPYFERMGTPRQSCIVACGNCGARHESSDEGKDSGWQWNQRATPPDPAQPRVMTQDERDVFDAALQRSTRLVAPAQPASAEPVVVGSLDEPKSDALGPANEVKSYAEQGWRRECDDTDAVLRVLGLDPEQCRTDGGSLNVPKIGSMLRDRATAYLCPAGCGCTWRDNGDGSMSLYGPSSRSCAACETMPLSKLLPLYTAPPALHEAARMALDALLHYGSAYTDRQADYDAAIDALRAAIDAARRDGGEG